MILVRLGRGLPPAADVDRWGLGGGAGGLISARSIRRVLLAALGQGRQFRSFPGPPPNNTSSRPGVILAGLGRNLPPAVDASRWGLSVVTE